MEDACVVNAGSPVGLNDFGVSATAAQVVCETEVAPAVCPDGWAFYLDDDGSEGVDSCVKISDQTAPSWDLANASCPAGSHLLTVRGFSTSLGLLAFVSSLTNSSGAPVYVGCEQAPGGGSGWRWLDDTDASNLNCGSDGCGLWLSSYPQ